MQPDSQFNGWKLPAPAKENITAAYDELVVELQRRGWSTGDTTIVYTLKAKVRLGQLINTPTHVTIGLDALEKSAVNMLKIGVDGVDKAAVGAMKHCDYHVTVAEADDRYAKTNPRWFSDSGTWVVGQDVDTSGADLKAALAEARTLLGR